MIHNTNGIVPQLVALPVALGPSDAARALGLGLSTLAKDRATGYLNIPYVRAGGAILYPVDALRQWLEARLERPKSVSSDAPAESPLSQSKRGPGRPRKLSQNPKT